MPPTTEDRLLDIVEAIAEIDRMLAGQSVDQFSADNMCRMATERYLEIICEASRKLPDDLKASTPEIEWRKMIDFGNVLRHAYHATDVGIVWTIIHEHLPALKAFVERKTSTS